jgi:hypothetical protein
MGLYKRGAYIQGANGGRSGPLGLCISQFQLRPSPPRDSVGHLYSYLSPRPGICSCVFTRAFVNIGLLPPGICRSCREKTAATSFLCCIPKWTTIKYVKQILYYIVECWFSSVNHCLRFSFSPYYIYCIYNEKLSAIKASVSPPFVDVFIWNEHDSFPCLFFVNSQKNN